MLTIGDAAMTFHTGGAPQISITRAPAPPPPTALDKARQLAAQQMAIARANQQSIDIAKNAYGHAVAPASPISVVSAPMMRTRLAASIKAAQPARSIWGGPADGGGEGGGASSPSGEANIPSGASDGGGPLDYAGTGYTPNRGGGGGGAWSGGSPTYAGGGSSDDGGGAPFGGGGAGPAGAQFPTPNLVQSAGAGTAPVPQKAAAVSASVGSGDWPWIVGIGVAAVAGVLLWRKFG